MLLLMSFMSVPAIVALDVSVLFRLTRLDVRHGIGCFSSHASCALGYFFETLSAGIAFGLSHYSTILLRVRASLSA